jgi:hypothetical protein
MTLYFILVELGRNQNIQEKLYQEIMHLTSDNQNLVTDDHLEKMKYLKNVVKESSRFVNN